jgi:hypothetical protein
MHRFGASVNDMREMCDDDLFLPRLQLLIIMSKAYLQGMPIGKHREKSILDNANQLFYHSLHISSKAEVKAISETDETSGAKEMSPEHIFHQRVQLLSVMSKAFVEDPAMGQYKKKALKENVEYLCNEIIFTGKISDMAFLKVA